MGPIHKNSARNQMDSVTEDVAEEQSTTEKNQSKRKK